MVDRRNEGIPKVSTRWEVHMAERRAVRPPPHPAPVRLVTRVRLDGTVRLARGWAAAAVATLLAAGSHTLAGGAATDHDAGPAPVVWLLTLALAGPWCTALAGRMLSWWRLAVGVGCSQLIFHWLYSWSAAPPDFTASAALAGRGAHVSHGGHGLSTVSGPDMVLPADHASLAMVAAHALAAVATVLLLRRGEAAAARVVQLAVGFVLRSPGARLARWVPAVRLPRLPSRPVVPALRAGALVLSALRWRGPPVPVRSA